MKIYEDIIKILKARKQYVATMESCTGGSLAGEITNHSGASEVLKFSAVTYSNEYKIKMGVDESIIHKYSVYSPEVAREMAYNIAVFAGSDYGIGVTGKLNNPDPANDYGSDDTIYIAIYEKEKDLYHEFVLKAMKNVLRKENKEYIIKNIGQSFLEIINS